MEPSGGAAAEVRLYRRPSYGAALVGLSALELAAPPRPVEVGPRLPLEEIDGDPGRRAGFYIALVQGGRVVDVARLLPYGGRPADAEDKSEDYWMTGSNTSEENMFGSPTRQHEVFHYPGSSSSEGGRSGGVAGEQEEEEEPEGALTGQDHSSSEDGLAGPGRFWQPMKEYTSGNQLYVEAEDEQTHGSFLASNGGHDDSDDDEADADDFAGCFWQQIKEDTSHNASDQLYVEGEDEQTHGSVLASNDDGGHDDSDDGDDDEEVDTDDFAGCFWQPMKEDTKGNQLYVEAEEEQTHGSALASNDDGGHDDSDDDEADADDFAGCFWQQMKEDTSHNRSDQLYVEGEDEQTHGSVLASNDDDSDDEADADDEGEEADYDREKADADDNREKADADDEGEKDGDDDDGEEEEEEDDDDEAEDDVEQGKSAQLILRLWPGKRHARVKLFRGIKWFATKVYRLTWLKHDELEEIFESSFHMDISTAIPTTTVFRMRDCRMDFQIHMLPTPIFDELVAEFKPSVMDFQFCQKIGGEQECRVFKCLSQGLKFALKTIRLKQACSREEPREVDIISSLKDKNVMEFYQAWREPWIYKKKKKADYLFILLELCQSTLKKLLLPENVDSLPDRRYLSKEIGKGTKAIHDEHIVHRDLKPDNIFFGFDMGVRIGDFGDACIGHDELGGYGGTPDLGTLFYSAPELKFKEKITSKADTYSLGVIFLEIFTRFRTVSQRLGLLKDLRKDGVLDDCCNMAGDPEGACALVKRMTAVDPAYRPSDSEILDYFQQ